MNYHKYRLLFIIIINTRAKPRGAASYTHVYRDTKNNATSKFVIDLLTLITECSRHEQTSDSDVHVSSGDRRYHWKTDPARLPGQIQDRSPVDAHHDLHMADRCKTRCVLNIAAIISHVEYWLIFDLFHSPSQLLSVLLILGLFLITPICNQILSEFSLSTTSKFLIVDIRVYAPTLHQSITALWI